MNEIRVNGGIVVKVNDNGDTIVINVEDQCFIDRFMNLNEKLDVLAAEFETQEFRNKTSREQIRYSISKTEELMEDIDIVFGRYTCQKVFGDIVPSHYLIAEFFDQLMPIAKEYMDERQKKIASKYSKDRKGGRSKYRTKEEIIQDAMR